MRWEIDRKLTITLTLSLIIILTINLLSFTSIRNLIESDRWVNHTYEVIERSQSLLVHLINVDTGSRGFIITSDERFLQYYKTSVPSITKDLNDLRRLTLDNSAQQKRIKSLEPEVFNFLQLVDEMIEGRKIVTPDNQYVVHFLRNEKLLMDGLRKRLGAVQSEERRLFSLRSRQEARSAFQTNSLIIIGTVVSLTLLCAVLYLLNNEMLRRRKAEEALQLSEERIRLAVTGAHVGTFHWDLRKKSMEWSAEFRRMCRIKESTQAGVEAFVNAIHPDDRERVITRSRAILNDTMAGDSTTSEYRIVDEDGTIRWILTNGRIYRDEQGHPQRMEGIAQDITARKNAEQEINQLNTALERQLIHVNDLNQELEAFTYSVSHDLRAPLRHINGFVQLLKKNEASSLSEKSAHYLTVISEAATSMGKLIDDLLSLSRTGRLELKKHDVNLNVIISDLIRKSEADLSGRNVEWKVNSLPAVYADANLIKIVFDNLISNALKYTRSREVAKIEIGSIINETHNKIFVKDNGVGFDMKYAGKLFGAFQRLHRPDEFEGTGVGLATVRRIINKHDGKVWAESEKNVGTAFYFTLPKIEE